MPHLVADLDNLSIQWDYTNDKATLLVWNPEMTQIIEQVPISKKVAQILADHGMASGS